MISSRNKFFFYLDYALHMRTYYQCVESRNRNQMPYYKPNGALSLSESSSVVMCFPIDATPFRICFIPSAAFRSIIIHSTLWCAQQFDVVVNICFYLSHIRLNRCTHAAFINNPRKTAGKMLSCWFVVHLKCTAVILSTATDFGACSAVL